MPEYLSPGVYVEEVEIGAKPIEGVSTSTAGFLGPTGRGPLSPRLITGFEDFRKWYGGHQADSCMAYAVEGFFLNGGKRCYIGRIAAADSVAASGPAGPLTIEALGPGAWGNNIVIKVEQGSLDDSTWQKAKLVAAYWKDAPPSPLVKPDGRFTRPPDMFEVYDNITGDLGSSDYSQKRINGLSRLIRVRHGSGGFAAQGYTALTAGNDGTVPLALTDYQGREVSDAFLGGPPDISHTGLEGFARVDDISILNVPDEDDDNLRGEIIAHCENLGDRFAILSARQTDTNLGTLNRPGDSKYAAFYSPWIKVFDPLTKSEKLVPPGGHIAGVYARSDIERGVHKAPANEVLKGATDLQLAIDKGTQDVLNPRGVNCIRCFPGRGIRVWGARTISSDPLWKYVNVRRLFLYLEESIDEGTQWVVFEPNNEKLWARVRATVTEFLTRVWRDGALMGTKPEEAFFVKCDRTTMTQDDIDNGRLICIIGVAAVKPAEFVIFRIAQWAGGSSATE